MRVYLVPKMAIIVQKYGGIFLRATRRSTAYRLERHPVSDLPRMVAVTRPARKVTAAAIARLNAELI